MDGPFPAPPSGVLSKNLKLFALLGQKAEVQPDSARHGIKHVESTVGLVLARLVEPKTTSISQTQQA